MEVETTPEGPWPSFLVVDEYLSRKVKVTVEERVQYIEIRDVPDDYPFTVFTYGNAYYGTSVEAFLEHPGFLNDDIIAWVEKRFVVAGEWEVSDV